MIEMKNNKGKTIFGGFGIALLLCLLMVMMPFASTVSNGDTTEVEAVTIDVEEENTTDKDALENIPESYSGFKAIDYGYDADLEMLGMREQFSKVFKDDEGGLDMIYSSSPIHYLNADGKWADIDYSIDATYDGYAVTNTDSPIHFEPQVETGYSISLDDNVQLTSGLDPMAVTLSLSDFNFQSESELLVFGDSTLSDDNKKQEQVISEGLLEQTAQVTPVYFQSDNLVTIGGNKINYQLTDQMDLSYTVAKDQIKQDLIISEMPDSYESTLMTPNEGYFGLFERFEIPDGHELMSASGDHLTGSLFTDGGLYKTSEPLYIVDKITGAVVVQIEAPVAYDTKSFEEDNNEYEAVYFLRVDALDLSVEIITAVPNSWLLAEETNFPVTIDPTFNFIEQTGSNYPVCGVATLDCHSSTNGRYEYDSYGEMISSPRFGFTFGTPCTTDSSVITCLPDGTAVSMIESITAKVDWDPYNNGFADIIILEDCGMNSLGAPDGDDDALQTFANPSGCLGVALPDYTPATGGSGPSSGMQGPFSSSSSWSYCSSSNCPLPGGNTYRFKVTDSYGDGFGGDLQIGTRAAGSSASYSPYVTLIASQTCPSWQGCGLTDSGWFSTTVAAGDEIKWRLGCRAQGEYYCNENRVYWEPAFPGVALPAIPAQTGATTPPTSPAASEAATASIAVTSGMEARMKWTCGSWCEENSVYYRMQGDTGWTASWTPGTGSPGAVYTSNTNSIVLQTVGTHEFLVFDSNDDGTGGGSGEVETSPTGTWGLMPITPEGQRLISMVSSQSLGYYETSGSSDSTSLVPLCVTATECNDATDADSDGIPDSPLHMLINAINTGSYIELGLGFANSLTSPTPHQINTANSADGTHDVDAFTLIIDFESNTPDTTPPEDKTPAHYQTDSYREGPRTLFLSVEDSDYAIDTSISGLPVLTYSITDSNSVTSGPFTAPSELVSDVCNQKEQTCTFSAQTNHISKGSVVDYHWTYYDLASPTTAKPTQSPNDGRAPTAGEFQFSVLNPIGATGSKLTILVENVLASYDSGVKSPDRNTIDRQMTYYASTGEYVFEFDTSECDSYTQVTYSCFAPESASDSFGHWDVLWTDTGSNDCYPGITTCTTPSGNNLELSTEYGGLFSITKELGIGSNLAMVFDVTENAWAYAGVGATPNIANRLEAGTPDANFVANAPSGMTVTDLTWSGYGTQGPLNQFSIGAGMEGRLIFTCGSWCSESTIDIDSGTNWNPSSSANAQIYALTSGTYGVQILDSYGDGCNGCNLELQVQQIGGGWMADPNVVNYANSGDVWSTFGWSIDLADTTTPSLGNAKFANTELGNSAGQANIVCVTTSGLIYFKESTNTDCPGDVSASSSGADWQGFAMGATKQGEQGNLDGMLWSIRDIAPDPDFTKPIIQHNPMGDSHALDRTVSAVIYDPGYQPSGINVAPNGNGGPELHYVKYTGTAPSPLTWVELPMIPNGDLGDCEQDACIWSADLPTLSSDRTVPESIMYKIIASDNTAAIDPATSQIVDNKVETTAATFSVANPTNTLVLEWRDLSSDAAGLNKCSFQTVMYDVTDEFEFHYSETCTTDEIQGLVGHRASSIDDYTINNLNEPTEAGNPHSNNIRVTVGPTGEYSYEYFDLGMTSPLPVSSSQLISASSSNGFRTQKCHANNWASLSTSCVQNFDIPSDFQFDYHGTSFDGTNPDNRIHVSLDGMFYFIDDGDTGLNAQFDSNWIQNPAMDDMDSSSSYYEDNMIAPWWSPVSNDYCSQSKGCDGVWYRTVPFDGQGTVERDDITVDTTWFAIDSPIKVTPSSSSGYLSVIGDAELNIEPGVEIIVTAGNGISFDSPCASLNALGTIANPITFDTSTEEPNTDAELWYGLAFTDECTDKDDRHVLSNVKISNTQYAAITAGSRPTGQSGFSCGTATQDCNVGEFVMTNMEYNNVESAFSHGSGQGTVVSMNGFTVNNARHSCFNFAENTVATLTGTVANPSTMNGCNTDKVSDGGAIVVDTPGSTEGELILVNVDITNSYVSLIDVDFKSVRISYVQAIMDIDGDGVADTPVTPANYWNALTLDYTGAAGSTDLNNFYYSGYSSGISYISSSQEIILKNVETDGHLEINPWGSNPPQGAVGPSGVSASLDGVTANIIVLHNFHPAIIDDVNAASLEWTGLTSYTQKIKASDITVSGRVTINGCGMDLELSSSSIGQLLSICSAGTKNNIVLDTVTVLSYETPGTIADDSIIGQNTKIVLLGVSISAPAVGDDAIKLIDNSMAYVIGSNVLSSSLPSPCADTSGSTTDCTFDIDSSSDIYWGGFATVKAYRQIGINQVMQSDAIIRSQIAVVDYTTTPPTVMDGIQSPADAITDSSGTANRVVVFTERQSTGEKYDAHTITASGSAGIGELGYGDDLNFIGGVQQTSTPLPIFTTFTIGSNVEIELVAPPVLLDASNPDNTVTVDSNGNPSINCAWMMNQDPITRNSTFFDAWDASRQEFVFKGKDLTLAANLILDGCSIALEGSNLIVRASNPVHSIVIVGVTGVSSPSLTLLRDIDTTKQSTIKGDNAKSVDITVQTAGTLDIQAGKVSDLWISNTKSGLLVVKDGGTLKMAGTSIIEASDVSGLAIDTPGGERIYTHPIVKSETGNVMIEGGTIQHLVGSPKTGIGLHALNSNVVANSLTIVGTYIGLFGVESALNLDGYTSTNNVFGIKAEGSMDLREVKRSAVKEGINPTSLDNCIINAYYGCAGWKTYTIDLTPYKGTADYLQTGLDMVYQGTRYDPWTGVAQGYIQVDNLKIVMSDSAQSWTVDSASDIGYYPYSSLDPAASPSTPYLGGEGGSASWDCNYLGRSFNPSSSYGGATYTWGFAGSMGALYGTSGWTFPAPAEFGFRWTESSNPSTWASTSPVMNWAYQTVWGLNNAAYFTGSGNNVQAPAPTVSFRDSCQATATSTTTQNGDSAILQYPIVDIRDPSIESITMSFDLFHEYNAWPGRVNYANNNNEDSAQVMARAGTPTTQEGLNSVEWSTTLPNNGVSIKNSEITGATQIGIDILGDTSLDITSTKITNPGVYGVKTSGDNDVSFNGLTVEDTSNGLNNNIGYFSGTTASGDVSIKNSLFKGLDVGIQFNNDFGTSIVNTDIKDGVTGLKIGGDANYDLMDLDITSMTGNAIEAEGSGLLKITDCDFGSSSIKDVVLEGSRNAELLDGTVDSSKIDVLGSGSLLRSRTYYAHLTSTSSTVTEDVTGAKVILSSREAGSYSTGTTDADGISSDLSFSVFKISADPASTSSNPINLIADYSSLFDTYQMSTVAQVGTYSYTSQAVNEGDFRYEIETLDNTVVGHQLFDLTSNPLSVGNNHHTFDLTKYVDIRICSSDSAHTVVAPCAGTFASTGVREYITGMKEYGSEESIYDSSQTVDLSGKVIMSDTGSYEMRDGTTYILDGATIFMTGYVNNNALGEWTVEEPYGTTFKMNGGSINGILPETSSGAPVGYSIGGINGVSDSPLSFDVNNVEFNGISSLSAYNGNRATGSWIGQSAYEVSQFQVTNSIFNHYRGFRADWSNTLYQEDMCMRLSGGAGGLIDGNTFNDCTVGIFFAQSDWSVDSSSPGYTDPRVTQITHDEFGSDQFVVSNNDFNSASGFNIWSYWDADADQITISDNIMDCNSCESHIAIYGDSSVAPTITGNTMTNGKYGVQTLGSTTLGVKGPQLGQINNNIFFNQETTSIFIDGGDADIIGNVITNSMGGITATGFDKPTEIISTLVAGINTGRAVNNQFKNFQSGQYSQSIEYNMPAGNEMQLAFTCGYAYCWEPEIDYKSPGTSGWTRWDPSGSSGTYSTILTTPGIYKFRMYDSYGDGPQGAILEVFTGTAGTYGGGSGPLPIPATTTSWACGGGSIYSCANSLDSNEDGHVVQNLGITPETWGFQMTDAYGDGANGNSYEFFTAPAGTWSTASSGITGTYAGGINDGGTNSIPFTGGTESDWVYVKLLPGTELKMVFDCSVWCYESGIDWGSVGYIADTWSGPDIDGNIITNTLLESFNAYGMLFEDCDMTLYEISTVGNIITIRQNALIVDSCTWEDTNSELIGTGDAGSIGFNDNNQYGASVVLAGTKVSGFETGVYKTSGDLVLTNGAEFTASGSGNGVFTEGIAVTATDTLLDGGAAGTGIKAVTGSVTLNDVTTAGLNGVSIDGEITPNGQITFADFSWTGGVTKNTGTMLDVSYVNGDITSITEDPSFTAGELINAADRSYINSIDFSLDPAKIVVDDESIVDESNWLNIDTTHMVSNSPGGSVGVNIISNNNYAPYTSDLFGNTMIVDADLNADWYGGNIKDSSGFAKPGEVDTNFYITSDSTNLYMAFDEVTENNIDVHFNTKDFAIPGETSSDINNAHTLPFVPEHALQIDISADSVTMSDYSSLNWGSNLNSGSIVLMKGTTTTGNSLVEISIPRSSFGTDIDSLDLVATVSTLGVVSVVHPAQSGFSAGAAQTLTSSFTMDFGNVDLADGTMNDEVLLYRSFRTVTPISGPSVATPLAGHTYDIMVKTEAVADPSTGNCDDDWATITTPILMDQSHSLDFDILRACPDISDDKELVQDGEIYSSLFTGCVKFNDYCFNTHLDEGTYEYVIYDSYGDGPNGGQVEIDTRAIGTDTWTLETSSSGSSWSAFNSDLISFTVASGYEARVRYDCSSYCSETSIDVDEIGLLRDINVYEDSTGISFVLENLVIDYQDVEATMEWDVLGSGMYAYDDILTDWQDVSATIGTLSIVPINDQFGTFELDFVVVDSHGRTDSSKIVYTVTNVNDAPVICDKRFDINCDNGEIRLYDDNGVFNVRNEGFGSYTQALGEVHNDSTISYIRDMDNENDGINQVYQWTATAECDQFTKVQLIGDSLTLFENNNWEEGGVCEITLGLEDDGYEFCILSTTEPTPLASTLFGGTSEGCSAYGGIWMGENTAQSVVVPFAVAPVNDAPVIADDSNLAVKVENIVKDNTWTADGANYKVTLVEDTTDVDSLSFDLSEIKSDIDHADVALSWAITDSEDCVSANYYDITIVGDIVTFDLVEDATTNAPLWEKDMLNANGIHQVQPTTSGNCPMYLSLSDSALPQMDNYTDIATSNYEQETVQVELYVTVDNVVENVPDYEFRMSEGFSFNNVSYIMPGTMVPVDFTIYSNAETGDAGPYTYQRLLKVTLHSNGHTEFEETRWFTPPAHGESMRIDDWEVLHTGLTTEVWVEMDVVTCVPTASACTPGDRVIQDDELPAPSHLSTVGTDPNPWSAPGKSTSDRTPAFEDKNWCNNLMSTNAQVDDTPLSEVVLQPNCQHTSDSYLASNSDFGVMQWQNTGQFLDLPVVVGTIGALSVPSFAPSLIAVCLTGLFVSVLAFSSRREDDEEDLEVEDLTEDYSAVSPVIATILMVAITVVLSGVVYVWAAELADTDTKGVPSVTFNAENVAAGDINFDHWKITVGQSKASLATQAVEVRVTYTNGLGELMTEVVNIASPSQFDSLGCTSDVSSNGCGVYGFSPFNSESIVTFGDVVDKSGAEVVSSFGSGDDIYVKTHLSDGTALTDVRIAIVYAPLVGQAVTLKTYTGLNWDKPVY